MKLSDAIKLGSMLKPQGFDAWTDHGYSCAMSAAGEAAGVAPAFSPVYLRHVLDHDALVRRFPMLATRVKDPTRPLVADVSLIIAHLNDRQKWTREQIAEWVSTIEPQDAESTQPELLPQPLAVGDGGK